MRYLPILALLFTGSLHATDMDKYVHYSVSYALSYTGSHILPVPLRPYSPLITLVVGAIKELTDEHFDNSDMLANGLGVFTSIVVLEWE